MISITRAFIGRQICRSMSHATSIEATSTANASSPEPRDDDLFRLVKIKCSAHEPAVLDSYETFIKMTAEHLDLNYVGTEEPFRTIKRKTMLASRFVHKKYRTQYESRSYYKHFILKNMTGSTLDTFLEYTQRNLPEGVLMETEKHRLSELPFELTNHTSQDSAERQEENQTSEK